MRLLPENFIDNRVKRSREYRSEAGRWEIKCRLLISDEEVEFFRYLFVVLDHRALLIGSRVEVELVPCWLIPYLTLEKPRCESMHLAIAKDPGCIVAMSREYGCVTWDEYIEILDNIKLFRADGMACEKCICMAKIQSSLHEEKESDKGDGELLWEIAYDVDDSISCHQDGKYIKENQHTIVKEKSSDRPEKPEEKTEEDRVEFFFIELLVDSGDKDEKVREYEEEKLP